MKFALVLITVFAGSFAHAAKEGYGSYECKLIAGQPKQAPTKAFSLIQLAPTLAPEGDKQDFLLKYDGKSVVVTVTTEDVMVQWKGPKGSGISGILFLDEDDQTALKIGKLEARYKCEWLD